MENKRGHWYTDENGNHYFVEEGQTPKEGWEASKRRKMVDGGKFKISEDGKDYRDVDYDEYSKFEADESEFDEDVEDDYKVEKNDDEESKKAREIIEGDNLFDINNPDNVPNLSSSLTNEQLKEANKQLHLNKINIYKKDIEDLKQTLSNLKKRYEQTGNDTLIKLQEHTEREIDFYRNELQESIKDYHLKYGSLDEEAQEKDIKEDTSKESYIPKTKVEKEVDKYIEDHWDKLKNSEKSLGELAYNIGGMVSRAPYPVLLDAVSNSIGSRKMREKSGIDDSNEQGLFKKEKREGPSNRYGLTHDPSDFLPKFKLFSEALKGDDANKKTYATKNIDVTLDTFVQDFGSAIKNEDLDLEDTIKYFDDTMKRIENTLGSDNDIYKKYKNQYEDIKNSFVSSKSKNNMKDTNNDVNSWLESQGISLDSDLAKGLTPENRKFILELMKKGKK